MSQAEILLYNSPEGDVKVDVLYDKQNIWLSQKQMSALFDVSVRTISEHLQNIFRNLELTEDSVIRNFRTTASGGKTYGTHVNTTPIVIANLAKQGAAIHF